MKRKLDINGVPSPEASNMSGAQELSFESLNLDPRLRQALIKANFSKPTPVQSQAIPLALEGRDILGLSILLFFGFGKCTDNSSSGENWFW